MTAAKKDIDVLDHVLRLLRFRASVYFHSVYCNEWQVTAAGSGRSTFHVVSAGKCWLHMPVLANPVRLMEGDLVVFPHDVPHVICNLEDLSGEGSASATMTNPACPDDESTAIICGFFEFDTPRANPVMNTLPDWLVIRQSEAGLVPGLQQVLQVMVMETGAGGAGTHAAIDKLSEMLFIYVVRYYMAMTQPDKGFFAALADIRIGTALKAFHAEPEKHWTVEDLAQIAHMSRAAFSNLFAKVLNESPMQYVTHWRMQIAYAELLESRRSAFDIAESVGYSNEAAFRKAFKQVMGITPGTVRRIAEY